MSSKKKGIFKLSKLFKSFIAFPPTPMFDVSQEGSFLQIKSYITQNMYDMYLINSVFTYMVSLFY